ncbi:hypothetical protein QYM36_015542 [Artemia franciscana]|uniref:RNA-directed DNA polymerase n=1 Tax=Artemia franciscana TaxID=6661 RepID=A0AA88KZJ0_ARTSF|nr:hypothetical protein QYM36_015542 [Artemia franciscana]
MLNREPFFWIPEYDQTLAELKQSIINRVNLMTDHLLLETIVRNPIHKAPPKVQRLMLQLQPYDLHLQFWPGSEIPITDGLSRLHPPDMDEKLVAEKDVCLHQLSRHLPARLFSNIQHELSTNKEIIFKGKKLIIIKLLLTDILRQPHTADIRVEKTEQRAIILVYWPGLNADIEQHVSSCQTCGRNMPSNQREPMMSHKIPYLPWQEVASVVFKLQNNDYLVTVDYHRHFFK